MTDLILCIIPRVSSHSMDDLEIVLCSYTQMCPLPPHQHFHDLIPQSEPKIPLWGIKNCSSWFGFRGRKILNLTFFTMGHFWHFFDIGWDVINFDWFSSTDLNAPFLLHWFSINWYSYSHLLAITSQKWLIFLPTSKRIFPTFDFMEVIIFLYFHSYFWWKFLSVEKYFKWGKWYIQQNCNKYYCAVYGNLHCICEMTCSKVIYFSPIFKGFCCYVPYILFYVHVWAPLLPPHTHTTYPPTHTHWMIIQGGPIWRIIATHKEVQEKSISTTEQALTYCSWKELF